MNRAEPLPLAPERLQVGEWTVEPALNRLSAGGRSVRVEPKAMEVLVLLAARAGQVVSREALLSSAWAGVVVGDDALTQVVIKLRKALGDVAENPAYLQTIPKRGYRLVAPVSYETAQAAQRIRRPGKRALGIIAAFVLAAAGAAWFYAVGLEGGAQRGTVAALQEPPDNAQPTLAIRPFEAIGDDAQAVLLARGMTADLVTDLSKLSGLSVIGVALYGGQMEASSAPAPAARYVISGSVQRVDERLRVQVHLADAQTGKPLWSERFERPLGELFAMQDEIGPKLLETLPAKVSEAELRRVAQRHTRNLEAYALFQRGQAALLVRQRAENLAARELFRRAAALDAAFARAYAGLALTYSADYRNQWTDDGPAALARAFEMARTAHEINPDAPETLWVLAFVHVERREHEQALRYLREAVRLYPSFADGYAFIGGIHTYLGQPAESVRWLRVAMRLNPSAGHLYYLLLGRAYLFLGDLEQARVNLEQALARNPENLEAHVYLAAAHVLAQDKDTASWQAEEIRVLHPGFSAAAWLKTYPMIDAGQRSRLAGALGDIGL